MNASSTNPAQLEYLNTVVHGCGYVSLHTHIERYNDLGCREMPARFHIQGTACFHAEVEVVIITFADDPFASDYLVINSVFYRLGVVVHRGRIQWRRKTNTILCEIFLERMGDLQKANSDATTA